MTAPVPGRSEGARGSCAGVALVRTCVVQRPVNSDTSVEVRRLHALTSRSTRKRALYFAANRPQPPSHTPRQEERGRNQHTLEVHRTQLRWIAHPVILDHTASGIGDQPL